MYQPQTENVETRLMVVQTEWLCQTDACVAFLIWNSEKLATAKVFVTASLISLYFNYDCSDPAA